jgi:hypothetical protein
MNFSGEKVPNEFGDLYHRDHYRKFFDNAPRAAKKRFRVGRLRDPGLAVAEFL